MAFCGAGVYCSSPLPARLVTIAQEATAALSRVQRMDAYEVRPMPTPANPGLGPNQHRLRGPKDDKERFGGWWGLHTDQRSAEKSLQNAHSLRRCTALNAPDSPSSPIAGMGSPQCLGLTVGLACSGLLGQGLEAKGEQKTVSSCSCQLDSARPT